MDTLDLINHVINLTLPALFMACFMVGFGRWVLPRRQAVLAWRGQLLVQASLGTAVLLGGLWWFGRDGKMVTYAALVLLAALAQWLLSGGWRK